MSAVAGTAPSQPPRGATKALVIRRTLSAPGVRSKDYYGKVEYTHVTVDLLAVSPAGEEAFLATMRDEVVPRLQARADAGEVVNWALFGRRRPRGRSRGHEYALVSRYKGFAPLAAPQIEGSAAAHLQRSVAWELMDILE